LKIDTINLLGAATQGELTTVSRHLWQWEGGTWAWCSSSSGGSGAGFCDESSGRNMCPVR